MVHSAETIVEDVHLLMAIDVMVADFFKLLSGFGWRVVPLDKGFFKEIPGIDDSWRKLSIHILAASVSVIGKTRSMTASCDTPRMLNKLTMSKIRSTCSRASSFLFP
ncbi:hypothetical protein Tco_0084610 [Tanacetum coccineum]